MGDALAAGTAERPLHSGRALRILKDEKLAAMVAAGGDDAFATLYQRHHQAIYRYCRSLVREESDARDALQNAMLAALASLRARPIEGAFKPWLFRIAHNESISIIRRRGREAPSEAPAALAAVSDDPETREKLRVLVSDLNALPDRQRGAIVMRELSGLSYAEIGAALGTSAAAGKQLVYEARSAMHELREGHEMSCELVRERISARDRRLLRGRKVRAHLRGCQPCQDFAEAIRDRRPAFALLAPPLSPLIAAAVLQDVFAGGSTGAGAGGAGGAAAGVTGTASGGVPAVAGPVALKAAAAVLLTGAAGVGAYEAGTALFSGSATAPAAVTRDASSPGGAHGQDALASSEHARAPSGQDHAGRAAAPESGGDKGQPNAGEDVRTAGDPTKASDPASPGAAGTQPAGGAGAQDSAAGGSSDSAGNGSADGGSGGGTSGGGASGTGSAEGGSGAGGSVSGSGGGDPSGGDSGGGDPGGGDPGGGDPGGGDPGGGTVEPPPPPPPPEPEPPVGVPPGHGGTPPGHGGVPPGQVDGDEPPGHRGGGH
jgi:RNA polymerase sigma factor (sigma-70 family)